MRSAPPCAGLRPCRRRIARPASRRPKQPIRRYRDLDFIGRAASEPFVVPAGFVQGARHNREAALAADIDADRCAVGWGVPVRARLNRICRPPPPVRWRHVSGSIPLLCSARTPSHQLPEDGPFWSSRSMTKTFPDARPVRMPMFWREAYSPPLPYQRSNDASGIKLS
jgi:hypothetical protein